MEYRYDSHIVFQIEYHFVLVAKYHYEGLARRSSGSGQGAGRPVKHWNSNIPGGGEQKSCAYFSQCTTDDSGEWNYSAWRIPAFEKALGATLLGARLFLRHSLADDGRDD